MPRGGRDGRRYARSAPLVRRVRGAARVSAPPFGSDERKRELRIEVGESMKRGGECRNFAAAEKRRTGRRSCARRRRASDAHSTPCACSFVDRERSTKAAFPKRSFGAQRRLGGRRHYAASKQWEDGSREHRRTCDLDARLPPSAVSLPFRKLHRRRDAPEASRCASVRPFHIDARVRLAGVSGQCRKDSARREHGREISRQKQEPRLCVM